MAAVRSVGRADRIVALFPVPYFTIPLVARLHTCMQRRMNWKGFGRNRRGLIEVQFRRLPATTVKDHKLLRLCQPMSWQKLEPELYRYDNLFVHTFNCQLTISYQPCFQNGKEINKSKLN